MNFHLWVIFLKTVNNYIDNHFMWSTVTPGFKLFDNDNDNDNNNNNSKYTYH